MSYLTKSILLDNTAQDAGGNATVVVSKEFKVTTEGSKGLRVDFKATDVTVVGSLAIRLQGRAADTMTWTNLTSANSSVSITVAAEGNINLTESLSADAADMPLYPKMRVVVVGTNASDAVTVDKLFLTQG